MKRIEYINPKKIKKCLCENYYIMSSISPYYIPLFGYYFWKKMKYIIKVVISIKKNSINKIKNILDIGCCIGIFSLNIGNNVPNLNIEGIDVFRSERNGSKLNYFIS